MHAAILKFVPNKLTMSASRLALQASKQSPHLLFGVGLVGFGATVYLASKAALELDERIDELHRSVEEVHELRDSEDVDYSEMEYKKDLIYVHTHNVVAISKIYAPTFIVGAVTVACLTKSHKILSNRNAALMAAYSAIEKSYSMYRARVIEELGEEKDREFRYPSETYKTISVNDKGRSIEEIKSRANKDFNPSAYARFFDQLCQDWQKNPEYNFLFLRAQQNYANDLLRSRGHVFLNDVYDMLGIPRSQAGSVVGWVISDRGDNYIDFGIFQGDKPGARDFVNGREGAILLDFNVDGVIFDQIGR